MQQKRFNGAVSSRWWNKVSSSYKSYLARSCSGLPVPNLPSLLQPKRQHTRQAHDSCMLYLLLSDRVPGDCDNSSAKELKPAFNATSMAVCFMFQDVTGSIHGSWSFIVILANSRTSLDRTLAQHIFSYLTRRYYFCAGNLLLQFGSPLYRCTRQLSHVSNTRERDFQLQPWPSPTA